MNTVTYLGELEQMLMWTVLRLGDGAYGMAIRDELEARAGRPAARGAVYITLDRLTAKGYLEARLADPTEKRAGRRKRYFTVTSAGKDAMAQSRRALIDLWTGQESAVEGR